MIIIYLLIPLSIVIAAGFLAAFIWAVRSGQFEDTCTPSMRMLLEEARRPQPGSSGTPPPRIIDEVASDFTSNENTTKHEPRIKPNQ